MKRRECSEEQFLKDVSTHAMKVELDNGVHRCITFRKPNSSDMYFTLTTWPGYLCISGDMGTFVFTRLADMFEFFRGRDEGELRINPQYWSEKCEASERRSRRDGDGVEDYDEETFAARVKEDFDQYFEDADPEEREETEAKKKELWEEIRYEVLSRSDSESEAVRAAMDFDYKFEDGSTFDFGDFWDHDLREYTYHFLWCLYAIAWGIRQYDQAKAK